MAILTIVKIIPRKCDIVTAVCMYTSEHLTATDTGISGGGG